MALPRCGWRVWPLVLSVAVSAVVVALSYYSIFVLEPPNYCTMTYMHSRLLPLPLRNVSRLESKYSLYVYREGPIYDEVERQTDPKSLAVGVPVLFVPGNAGNHDQVRSMASVSARMSTLESHRRLFDQYGYVSYPTRDGAPTRNRLNFYTLHFNEELSAFSGQLLFDQTEFLNDCIRYILSLYPVRPPKVIVVGHSMGGVVATTAMSMPNYVPDSVDTIISLNSPHRPVMISHPSVHTVYDQVKDFWNAQLSNFTSEIQKVSVVSIAGGARYFPLQSLSVAHYLTVVSLRDTLIRSELCTLDHIVQPRNRLVAMSTQIPHVWSEIDHNAGVWCNQLMVTLAQMLYDLIDEKTLQATKDLDARMAVFQTHLKSRVPAMLGFPSSSPHQEPTQIDVPKEIRSQPRRPLSEISIRGSTSQKRQIDGVGQLVGDDIRLFGKEVTASTYAYRWDLTARPSNSTFLLLTNIPKYHVLLCDAKEQCTVVADLAAEIPYQKQIVRKFFSEIRVADLVMLRDSILADFKTLLVHFEQPNSLPEGFLFGQMTGLGQEVAIGSFSDFSWFGARRLRIPKGHALVSTMHLDDLGKFHNLKLTTKELECEPNQRAFSPLVLQYSEGMSEERYESHGLVVRFHEVSNRSVSHSDVHLALFSDPNCAVEVEMTFDLLSTLGMFARSHVNVLVAPSFALSLLAHALQMYQWKKKGMMKGLHVVLVDLLALLLPYIAVFVTTSLALDYAFGSGFVDSILAVGFEHLELESHSFSLMPQPWPSVYTLILINFMAYSGIWLWSYVCYIVLLLPTLLCRPKKTQDALVPSEERVPSQAESAQLSDIGSITIALICLLPLALHQLGHANIYEGVSMVLSLLFFVFAARRRASNDSLFYYDHSLLVIYSKIVALVGPEFVIFLKDRRYQALPWSFNAFMSFCLTVHLAFSERILVSSKHSLDLLACILLAVGLELYCIYPIYRIVNFMCFFLLFNLPSLLRS